MQCWDLRSASACGPLVAPDTAVSVPLDYVWTWSCNPVLKASLGKELSASPKSFSAESELLATRNPTKGLRTLLLLQDRLGKPRETNGLPVARICA